MIVSDRYKLVFVHVPKTGGSAITHELATLNVWKNNRITRGVIPHWQPYYHQRSGYTMHCGIASLRREHEDYTQFACVRSPFTWVLSNYRRVEKLAGRGVDVQRFHDWLSEDKPHLDPRFREWISAGKPYRDPVMASAFWQFCWIDEKQTHLLRFETLADDLRAFLATAGVECNLGPPIPGQESISSRAKEFYSTWAEQRVVELWKPDFEKFGYAEALG